MGQFDAGNAAGKLQMLDPQQALGNTGKPWTHPYDQQVRVGRAHGSVGLSESPDHGEWVNLLGPIWGYAAGKLQIADGGQAHHLSHRYQSIVHAAHGPTDLDHMFVHPTTGRRHFYDATLLYTVGNLLSYIQVDTMVPLDCITAWIASKQLHDDDVLKPGQPVTVRIFPLCGGTRRDKDAVTAYLRTTLKDKGVPDTAIEERIKAISSKIPAPKLIGALGATDRWAALKKLATEHQIRLVTADEAEAVKTKADTPSASSDGFKPPPKKNCARGK